MKRIPFIVLFVSQVTNAQIGIGTTTPHSSSILDVHSSEKGLLLPRLSQAQKENISSPGEGLVIFNLTTDCIEFYNGTDWTNPCGTGLAPLPPDATPALPAGMEITNLDQSKFIASIYDDDYLPYTFPSPGTHADTSQVNADGSTETLIDIQGVLGTNGSNDTIPVTFTYTASGSGVSYGALSISKTVHDSVIENSTSSIQIVLTYPAGTTTGTTGVIQGKIYAQSTLNAKQLDLNSGIGNDAKGIVMAMFDNIPVNSSGVTGTLTLHDIPGIPDRQFRQASADGGTDEHDFLYLPVSAEDGNVWLNNNLGANYSNIKHASFSVTQQATSHTDHNAYGSLFQWGRLADGHELMNSTGATTISRVHSFTSGTSGIDVPGHSNPYQTTTSPIDWRSPQNNNLWQGGSGINNPCPEGFRLPTNAEWQNYISAASVTDRVTAASKALALPSAGSQRGNTLAFSAVGTVGQYYSSTTTGINANTMTFHSGAALSSSSARVNLLSVRCISN